MIVEPDAYGLSGRVVAQIGAGELERERLVDAVAKYRPPRKDHGQHVQTGIRLGLKWQTEIPVTDREFVQAMEHLWGEKYRHEPPGGKAGDAQEQLP